MCQRSRGATNTFAASNDRGQRWRHQNPIALGARTEAEAIAARLYKPRPERKEKVVTLRKFSWETQT